MNKTQIFIALIIVIAVITLIMTLLGIFPFENIMLNFLVFVFWLAIIAALAVIGAIFVGMIITHKIMTSEKFTPFEIEMLSMREDVKKIMEKVENIEKKLNEMEKR